MNIKSLLEIGRMYGESMVDNYLYKYGTMKSAPEWVVGSYSGDGVETEEEEKIIDMVAKIVWDSYRSE